MFEEKHYYKLTLNQNAEDELQSLKYFFRKKVKVLFKVAMNFLSCYMEFKKKYPDAKIYFISEKENTKQEITMLKDD